MFDANHAIFRGFSHNVQLWLPHWRRGHKDFRNNNILLGVRSSHAADCLFLLAVTEIYSHSRENVARPGEQKFCNPRDRSISFFDVTVKYAISRRNSIFITAMSRMHRPRRWTSSRSYRTRTKRGASRWESRKPPLRSSSSSCLHGRRTRSLL